MAAVQALIGAGADLNLQDKDGFTALIRAAANDHTATVQTLIGAGADLNLQNKDGFTALIRAAANEHMATVQALIGAGADRSIRAEVLNTPRSFKWPKSL
jgi:ankyrin repeat protein